MSDATPTPPPAITAPATPLRARWRRRVWWALPVAAALILLLIEISAPVHAAFAELDLFLFHAGYGILVSAALLGVARAIEHVLARPGIYGDD